MAKPKYLAERAALESARSEVEKCKEVCKAADAARDAAYAVAHAADAALQRAEAAQWIADHTEIDVDIVRVGTNDTRILQLKLGTRDYYGRSSWNSFGQVIRSVIQEQDAARGLPPETP